MQRRKSQEAVLMADKRRRLLLAARASVLQLEFFQKAGDVYHLVAAFDKVCSSRLLYERGWRQPTSSSSSGQSDTGRCNTDCHNRTVLWYNTVANLPTKSSSEQNYIYYASAGAGPGG